jgi:hypothetical protein
MFGDIFNMPYKDPEQQKEAMRAIMREWRTRQKVKHTLQADWEKAIEEEYVKKESWKPFPEDMEGHYEEQFVEIQANIFIRTMNQATYSLLYQTAKAVREKDNLDDVKKIYQDLWATLKTVRAELKEDQRKALEDYKADFKEM